MKDYPKISLILHNLRSAQNVGAIFRVADAIGVVGKIYLTGYTPSPIDRFGRKNKEIVKTSLGAENYVEWESHKNFPQLLIKLQANEAKKLMKLDLVALEQADNSVDYRKIKIQKPTAIIVGNEVRGLSPAILKKCDLVVEIPMRGRKESLNAAVACGIFLFQTIP